MNHKLGWILCDYDDIAKVSGPRSTNNVVRN